MQDESNGTDERGASVVEYVLLVAGVLVMAMASVNYLGAAAAGEFGAIGDVLAFDDAGDEDEATPEEASTPNECPNGWNLSAGGQTKKNGQNVDANGDGFICVKDIPGNGKGNTNNNQNVKDNN